MRTHRQNHTLSHPLARRTAQAVGGRRAHVGWCAAGHSGRPAESRSGIGWRARVTGCFSIPGAPGNTAPPPRRPRTGAGQDGPTWYSILPHPARLRKSPRDCQRNDRPDPHGWGGFVCELRLAAQGFSKAGFTKRKAPAHTGRGFLRRAFLHCSTMPGTSEAQRAKRPS